MDNTFPVVVEVDGTTYNLTHDSLIEIIKEHTAQKLDIALRRDKESELWRKVANVRNEVYDFFKECLDQDDEWVKENKGDINFLLERIGSDKLKTLFNAVVTVEVSITDIEADDEDDISSIIQDNLSVDCGYFSADISGITIDEVEEQ